jgi:hypothetical protein
LIFSFIYKSSSEAYCAEAFSTDSLSVQDLV